MLELRDLRNSNFCELIDAGSVHFLAGEADDDVAAVNQRGQRRAQKLRLDAKLGPVVNAGFGREQIRID